MPPFVLPAFLGARVRDAHIYTQTGGDARHRRPTLMPAKILLDGVGAAPEAGVHGGSEGVIVFLPHVVEDLV